MERRHLESGQRPTTHTCRGFGSIPLGIGIIVAGIFEPAESAHRHRSDRPHPGRPRVGRGRLPARSARYYRDHYGSVTPTRDRVIRQAIAIGAWIVVLFVGANEALFWSPDGPQCIYVSAFALATLAYYAILVGLRPHHLVIWGAVFVAGLLPIWGGLGADRDALAMIPLGLVTIASGLLDQRVLARSLAVPTGNRLEGTHVGG